MDREKQLQAKFGYLQAEINEIMQQNGFGENATNGQEEFHNGHDVTL